jgi:hypothetical protein
MALCEGIIGAGDMDHACASNQRGMQADGWMRAPEAGLARWGRAFRRPDEVLAHVVEEGGASGFR